MVVDAQMGVPRETGHLNLHACPASRACSEAIGLPGVINSDAAKSNTIGMKPGSTCSVNQHSSGTYCLADLISKGKFLSSIPPGTRTLEHTMHVSYRY